MIRSMAASMTSSSLGESDAFELDELNGFELRNRLVGEPEPVHLAALKHLDDDLQQPLVGDKAVGDGAGATQVIRGDGIGIAHHFDIHDPQSALDQHGPLLRHEEISTTAGRSSV